jgi:Tol biopolymer transport system component
MSGYGGGGSMDIGTVRTDGSALTTVAEAGASEEYPAWSPDGRQIEYTRGEPGSFYDVWVMNADGSGKKRLTRGRLGGTNGGWSPDGSRIAYSSWFYPPDEYPPAHVFVMSADGSSPRQVTRGSDYDFYPVWATTEKILFLRLKSNDASGGDVYSVRSDGGGLTRLTRSGTVGGFAVSPDGKRLAVHDKQHSRIAVLPLGSSAPPRTLLDTDFGWEWVTLSWSPDGKALVLGRNYVSSESASSIYVINADGSGLSEVPGVSGLGPAWRPE